MLIDNMIEKNTPRYNWINFVGVGKRRKTLTALEIAQQCDSLYIDCEESTRPYKCNAVYVNNAAKFNQLIRALDQDKKIYDLIICDPIDILANMIKEGILKHNNQSDLTDIKEPGVGNGWSLLYSSFTEKIDTLIRHSIVLVTITHLKLKVISKNEDKQITSADFNLMGQLRSFVNDKADATLIFESKRNEEGESYIKVGTSSETHATTFGSRGGILAKLFEITTTDELKTFILNSIKEVKNEVEDTENTE